MTVTHPWIVQSHAPLAPTRSRPWPRRPWSLSAHLASARPTSGGGLHFRPGRFGLLWAAAGASSIGDGLALVAFPLLATTMTRSPLAVAGVAVAAKLPWVICSLPAGAVADRFDRRRLLTVVEWSRMALLGLLGILIATGTASLAALYVTTFALGTFQIVYTAATQSVLPLLVSEDGLASANGRLYATQAAGEQFVGPAIGGVAFAAVAALPFVADAISFAASALLLGLAFPRRRRSAPADSSPSRASQTMRRPMVEGAVWFAHHRVLRLTGALVAAFALCQSMGLAILVLLLLGPLHLSRSALGGFLAVAALGNVAGAAAAPRLVGRLGPARVLAGAGVAAGAALVGLSAALTAPVAAGALALEALAVGAGLVAAATLRQRLIPTALAGRVNVVMRTCAYGAAAAGGVVGGLLATRWGPRLPFATGGVAQLVVSVVLGLLLIRRTTTQAAPANVEIDIEAWVSAPAAAVVEGPAQGYLVDVA